MDVIIDETVENDIVYEATFRLKVDEIRHLQETRGGVSSQPCYISGYAWRILFISDSRGLAIYIECDKPESDFWSCQAVGELRLIPQRPGKNLKRYEIKHTFYRGSSWAGERLFWDGGKLDSPADFVEDDSIVIEAWISASQDRLGIDPFDVYV